MTLLDYLHQNRLTPYAMSLMSGVTHPTIYRTLSGRTRPSMSTMQAISDATGGLVSTIEDFAVKKSKASVNYTDHASMRAERCSLCRHWRAPAGCTLVEGRIAAAGWCRLFQR